ncbi:pyrroline-5-carboxylate reductase [Ruicaihuangia caeni]|uniref:Pyrroline-5-carboxylate reductase n=1 Tax=Ruicaihuangia caeni TaxID=3042517 RepID=A0AAW6TA36_9MICO|nr:pyrroline-5-carboxylate reductase [Klugiella sp. YN-L-19]MDI2098935.1 pyrroline-5-carboxylate reductase [Klugiella sp. YN-L-19]
MTNDLPAVAILGAGSMGGAILSGILRSGAAVERDVRVTNRSATKAAGLRQEGVVSLALESDETANLAAVEGARIVILGVKPAMVEPLLREIAPALEDDAIVVSIAAGVTTEALESIVPGAVMRAMPNTPVAVGRGVTSLAAGTRATEADVALVRRLFSAVGAVVEMPEHMVDAALAIAASGPAYVYYFTEQLAAAATGFGFDERQASALAIGTVIGAGALLDGGEPPAELRRAVTSPNGTTERAIAELERGRLGQLVARAATAARDRARELAAGG